MFRYRCPLTFLSVRVYSLPREEAMYPITFVYVPPDLSECEGVLSAPGGGVSDQKGAVRGILQLLDHLATK